MADATRACPRGPSQPWDPRSWRSWAMAYGQATCCPYGTRNAPRGRVCRGPLAWRYARRVCRRGLPICHEHDDCRRSLALGVACAGMRRRDAVRPSVVRPSGSVAWLVDSQTGALVWMCEPADA